MISVEKFYETLLRLMDLFPNHYVHNIEKHGDMSEYEFYLKQKGLNVYVENSLHMRICKTVIKPKFPILYYYKWYWDRSYEIKFVITHHTINGTMKIEENYPWPLFYSENTDDFKDFWLCPNPLPELQLKLIEAFFGKEWHKHITFYHCVHIETNTETLITHASEKLL